MIEKAITIKILGEDEDCLLIAEITRSMLDFMALPGKIEIGCPAQDAESSVAHLYPQVVVDEKIVCQGRIPRAGEISTWLADAVTQD